MFSMERIWTGRILSGLVAALLLFIASGNLMMLAPVVEGTAKMGYDPSVIVPIGIVLLVSTLLYVIPRTSVVGAILLTGYFGGATATHVRVGEPFAIPVVFGALVWLGLYFRDSRIRALTPLVAPLQHGEAGRADHG